MSDGLQPVVNADRVGAASLDGAATPSEPLDQLDRLSRLATSVSDVLKDLLNQRGIELKDMGLNGSSGYTKDSSIANWDGFNGKTAGLAMLAVDPNNGTKVTFEIYMPQKSGIFGKSDSALAKIPEEAVRTALAKEDADWSVTQEILKGHQVGRGSAAKSLDRLTVTVKVD